MQTPGTAAGLPVNRLLLSSIVAGGALAGLGGMLNFAGVELQLRPDITLTFGYVAFLASWLGRHQPGKVLLAALLFSAIAVGGNGLQLDYGLDGTVVDVLLGLIVMAPLAMSIRNAKGAGMNGIEQTLIGGVDAGTAILLPALGELIGERAGVVNLGIEGCMLAGALSAYAVGVTTGSALIGALAGMAAGAAVALVHALLTVIRGADQLASGLAVWFLALGLTSVFGTSYINETVTPLGPISIPVLSHIPWVGPILFRHDVSSTSGTYSWRWCRSCCSAPGSG